MQRDYTSWNNWYIYLIPFYVIIIIIIGYVDTAYIESTARSHNCKLVLPSDRMSDRCSECTKFRKTLARKEKRSETSYSSNTDPVSHANYRYLTTAQLVDRMQQLHYNHTLSLKYIERLKAIIRNSVEREGVSVDEELHEHLCSTMMQCSDDITKAHSSNSFKHLFWQQQLKASSVKNVKGMRWHPSMIKWCLYLRHRSSGAYELLRDSGCVMLPSQRTLRDYTYHVKASTGFSSKVDEMLKRGAESYGTEERDKCVLLLLDEMHVRHDLVYDKHSGELSGFVNLGEMNEQLLDLENSLKCGNPSSSMRQLASTMMVFMVKGLFSRLQFPYVQFPCNNLSGDLLYDPFWEAVSRIERCGLKVCTCIMHALSPIIYNHDCAHIIICIHITIHV